MEKWEGILEILSSDDNIYFLSHTNDFYLQFKELLKENNEKNSNFESFLYFWENFTRRYLQIISKEYWNSISTLVDLPQEDTNILLFNLTLSTKLCEKLVIFQKEKYQTIIKLKEILLSTYQNSTDLQCQINQRFREIIHIELYSKAPSSFFEIIYHFFLYHFNNSSKWFQKEQDEEVDDFNEKKNEKIQREKLLNNHCQVFSHLELFSVTEHLFTRLFFQQIQSLVSNLWGKSEKRYLKFITLWLNNFLFPWLENIFLHDVDDQKMQIVSSWKTRTHFFTLEKFAELKMKEMFDIILQYPESMPSLLDLKECLSKTTQLNQLVQTLIALIKKRLLHSGANTMKIIEVYINTIKSLKVIDPSGIAIDRVGEPICDYLRKREDIIRCIVSMFTDEKSDLYRELRSGLGSANAAEMDDSDDDGVDWEPPPIDALPNDTRRTIKDIFSLLVNIFGSTDLFVDEYRNMLSDRLLSLIDYETLKESEILELLKRRFGEQSLQNCQIMIKDMKDSNRIDIQYHKVTPEFPLHSFILSYLFWPSFIDIPLTLPAPIQQAMEDYGKKYEVLKRPRKLEFIPHLGTVSLELSFRDQIRQFNVKPIQATIIYHFQSKEEWKEEELVEVTGVPVDHLKNNIKFWMNQGIISFDSSSSLYQLRDDDAKANIQIEEVEQSNVQSVEDKKKQMWELCKNFIFSMLQNQGPLPPDKIHSFLGLWFHDDYFGTTIQNLKNYLNSLVKEDELDFDDPNYLVKNK